jgi:hypothetical protein
MGWSRVWVIAALGALFLAGCDKLQPEPAEMKEAIGRITGAMEQQARAVQQTLPVGETLTVPSGETLTLQRVGSELPGVTVPEGKRPVVLEVRLMNPGGEALALDPEQDFWITDITGRRYQPFSVRGLPADGLPAGGQATGALAFAVEPDASEMRFGWQRSPMTVFVIG